LALVAPVALASVITVVRFTAGRSASVVDVAAAALGCSLAVVLPVVWRHFGSRTSEDSDGRGPAATR
jgi:VanZ family protein